VGDREHRFRKHEEPPQRGCRVGGPGARRGKTRRRRLLFTAMALGPGLVLAEGVGSGFCPLTLSRRLRLFAPPALPVTHAAVGAESRFGARTQRPRLFTQAGEAGLLKRTIASNATYSVRGNAAGGVRSAGPERSTDSSTVGDTSPRAAFPALSSLVRGSKPASPA